MNKRLLILGALLILTSTASLFATKASSSINAGEQKKAEKGLKDNRYFIYYINASITNTGSEDQKSHFEEAIQHDLVAQFYYLRFSFHESYVEVRTTQEILLKLYRENLDEEIKRARAFLHADAPQVVHSEDAQARLYIRLAYRNLKHAQQYMIMADNYKSTLYSMRLYKYVKAMKKIKEAKRYAVTTAIQVRIEDKEKLRREYQSYDDITALIKETIEEERRDEVISYHLDSYYRFTGDMSEQERVWEESRIDEFEPYKEYLEKTE